jgi:hypothetical protein
MCPLNPELLAGLSGISSVLADEGVSSSTAPRHVEGGVGPPGRGGADDAFADLVTFLTTELLVVGTLDGAEASERSCMKRAGAECVFTTLSRSKNSYSGTTPFSLRASASLHMEEYTCNSHLYKVHERVDVT